VSGSRGKLDPWIKQKGYRLSDFQSGKIRMQGINQIIGPNILPSFLCKLGEILGSSMRMTVIFVVIGVLVVVKAARSVVENHKILMLVSIAPTT
jgi:hypothetical protein